MTHQEIHTSPFKIGLLRIGGFIKKHAITFAVGLASGIGATLAVQHFAGQNEVISEMQEMERTQ